MGLFEKAAKPKPIHTPSRRAMMVEQSAEAYERAARKFDIARFAAYAPGSLRAKRKYIAAAMKSGVITPGPVPAPSTIGDLQKRWKAGAHSVGDYVDEP